MSVLQSGQPVTGHSQWLLPMIPTKDIRSGTLSDAYNIFFYLIFRAKRC
jgi:hypothetical protein